MYVYQYDMKISLIEMDERMVAGIVAASTRKEKRMNENAFMGLFKNEEFKALLAAYRKTAEPLEYIDSLPPLVTPHYRGPRYSHKDTEHLRRQVMERQAALGEYLLRVLEIPASKGLLDE